ncbi:DUF21-domain-containing protein [Basidiobolus meristosporus CBS 931.73]|uniref:DUF21-domain-containing protein n=1 Tax=Basidiobolus meristosporus CBS 931.73 TaxID=1314790 RepID=A0A1Y1XUI2_9FUNG|nr:DUF21-domain-containing protein [Basidiobolus meristosporus CBS 931.73]|eukprot:ORX89422.1 DUF21-domain-containing protein [Basidiobolus meristosporus CBS 931.73]
MELKVDPGSFEFWWKVGISIVLVALGGLFAGLTLGLMGLDETNLEVLMESGEGREKKYAKKVYKILHKRKHWVLATLLLSNVAVNETLPVIIDSVFGSGWEAVLISTVCIVIFGEVIPQALCVRFGLAIGASLAWFVELLMYITGIITYPVYRLLDWCLGEDRGTAYRKPELKTLVSLHQTGRMGNLSLDEVTIIQAVLDLTEKPVSRIMTPIEDVFILSSEHILDQKTVDQITRKGYSRIPVYEGDRSNLYGVLLVKQLISYDPDDNLPVKEFTLRNLPVTNQNTSCLDILNFFQEGKSHMALVVEFENQTRHAKGVVTLEDVMEELIGEEIIDETDVYIDGMFELYLLAMTMR